MTDDKAHGISPQQTWKNSIRIMSASMIVQIAGVVCSPIIARLYTPEDIGALGVLLALVGIGTTMACGRYEQAIIVEAEPKDSAALWHLSLLAALTVSLVVGLLTYVLGAEEIALWLETPDMEPFVWLAAPLIFLSAAGYALTMLFNSRNEFRLTQRFSLVQGIGNNVLKIVLSPLAAAGLYVANVLSHLAGLIASARHVPTIRPNPSLIRRMARRHWRYPIFNMPHALISTVVANLPVLIFAKTFEPAAVGCFALCLTLGYKPVNVFALSANQALFHSSSRNQSSGNSFAPLLRRFVWRTALVTVPLAAVLYLFMPQIIDFFFGSEWGDASGIMQALLPIFVLSILSLPLSFIPLMLRKQAAAMTLEIVSSVARTAALIVGTLTLDITGATWLYSLTHAAFLAIQLVWYLLLLRSDSTAEGL